MSYRANFGDHASIALQAKAEASNPVGVEGHYKFECWDKEGNLKWVEEFPNLVVAVGKELMMNTLLRGSNYTVVGPYLGLIGSTFTAVATDTMTTKTWVEYTNYTAGGSSSRPAAVFAAATSSGTTPGNVTTSAATSITFTVTGVGGTIFGCFLVTGPFAVPTFNSTAGVLYSEGLFTAAKGVSAGDTVAVTYSTTATS